MTTPGRSPSRSAAAVLCGATLITAVITQPARGADAAPGQAVYQRYCALCHGLDGRGAGPLAQALKTVPPDLTQLSKRAGGTFPASRFAETVWTGRVAGHGKQAMLEWSKIFGGDGGQLEATSTILDLTLYVETLQAK